jgi:hypothetical protein
LSSSHFYQISFHHIFSDMDIIPVSSKRSFITCCVHHIFTSDVDIINHASIDKKRYNFLALPKFFTIAFTTYLLVMRTPLFPPWSGRSSLPTVQLPAARFHHIFSEVNIIPSTSIKKKCHDFLTIPSITCSRFHHIFSDMYIIPASIKKSLIIPTPFMLFLAAAFTLQ